MEHPGPRRGRGDPYRLLGLDTGASRRDVARAYRRAVHDAHPDTQPGDPRAAARFRALTGAYELLSDPGRRADYDRQHPAQRPDVTARQPGPPPPAGQPGGQPIWAGPVRIEPPGGQAPRHDQGSSPAADFEDPPVILGRRAGRRRGRPW
jgi:curved DNA-binding protein CbpA